jgi:hypothetical protein
MKFSEILKKANAKNRPVSVLYFGQDLHVFSMLEKEFNLVKLSNNKMFFNKVRVTFLQNDEDYFIATANLKIDYILLDRRTDDNLAEFISVKLQENNKIKIISVFENKKLIKKLGLSLRKKEYFEYYQ